MGVGDHLFGLRRFAHDGVLDVTRDVGELSHNEIARALESGAERARKLFDRGLIEGAVLQLCGDMLVIGPIEIERQRSRPLTLENAVDA